MSTSRREFMAASAAVLALSSKLAACARRGGEADAQALLARIAEDLLADYPESATSLGIDKGERAGLKARLTDRSAAGQKAMAERVAERLARLQEIDVGSLDEATRLDFDVVRTAHEIAADGFRFPYGDMVVLNQGINWANGPYVVAQNKGAFLETPGFLEEQHTIESREDAEAYLARLAAYAGQLVGETGRLQAAAEQGVIAPDFLLDKTLAQIKVARAGKYEDWPMIASFIRKTEGMPGKLGVQAWQIADDKIAPALDLQIAELEKHRAKATSDAGAWKLPDGEAYYAWNLRASTTTEMTPEEIHERGKAELAELNAEMETILQAEGMTEGTVGARMAALLDDPRFKFAEGDPGRAEVMQFLEERVADIRARLPQAFDTLAPGNFEIKRMAPEVEPGAPGAYGGPGSIDGKVPGKYWINLRTTDLWRKFQLPTLTHHESLPGHVWQGEYAFRLPLIRTLLAFNAYSEGWALYAEQLADELGIYENQPIWRLGYLQSIAFRACRLVVDTGLHAKRWTREEAIRWFMTANGSSELEVRGEVDRYCAWPGQACGYKIGHSEINRLRRKAREALGAKFDFKAFNDAVVMTGGVPMVVLARRIDDFIAARQKA